MKKNISNKNSNQRKKIELKYIMGFWKIKNSKGAIKICEHHKRFTNGNRNLFRQDKFY